VGGMTRSRSRSSSTPVSRESHRDSRFAHGTARTSLCRFQRHAARLALAFNKSDAAGLVWRFLLKPLDHFRSADSALVPSGSFGQ